MHFLTRFLRPLLPLLQAETCLLCGRRHGQDVLCATCQETLPMISDACQRCGRAIATHTSQGMCLNCQLQPPPYDYSLIPFAYSEPINQFICQMKYRHQLMYVNALASLCLQRLGTRIQNADPHYLLPVPLTRTRQRQRGFNQSLELAKRISRQMGIPTLAHSCLRTGNQPPQAGLSAYQRKQNVTGAFEVTKRKFIWDKHILLVDDVVTTGSTIAALTRALKKQGAREVGVLAIAKTF